MPTRGTFLQGVAGAAVACALPAVAPERLTELLYGAVQLGGMGRSSVSLTRTINFS
jgi:hypothetical protein